MVLRYLRLGLFMRIFEPPEAKVGWPGYLTTLDKKLVFTYKAKVQKSCTVHQKLPHPDLKGISYVPLLVILLPHFMENSPN